MRKILTVVGARPQFVKAAMLSLSFKKSGGIVERIVHTGQHYDSNMSEIFFEEMGIPSPAHMLEVGSATHGRQTGRMLEKMDAILEEEKPDCVLVYGDTNSTLAGALAAVKMKIPVIHVEAGMRSYVREQPEEVNRVLTDHCSSLLLCSSSSAADNLREEKVKGDIDIVGDVMRDSTMRFVKLSSDISERLRLEEKQYMLWTCHRPESTDHPERLKSILDAILCMEEPVVFPIHPRTRQQMKEQGLMEDLLVAEHIQIIEPVGYIEMLHLIRGARRVITDSGGIQKEAYFLAVPCITTREFTEWNELVDAGWNTVTGYDTKRILEAAGERFVPEERPMLFGDGHAADRAVRRIIAYLKEKA